MTLIALKILLLVQLAHGKGSRVENDCVKFLELSSIMEVNNLAQQLLETQKVPSREDLIFGVKYIDNVKADLGIIKINPFNSVKVTAFGPTPDPSKRKIEVRDSSLKSFYFNIMSGKQSVKIEVFTKGEEIEILAEGYGKSERYVLRKEGNSCIPLQKYSGSGPAMLRFEADAYYCADLKPFFSRYNNFFNLLGNFNYESCDKSESCRASAREIYEARYLRRSASYFQSSTRPVAQLVAVPEFKNAEMIKPGHFDRCSDLLKKAAERITNGKMQVPEVKPGGEVKKAGTRI